VGIAKIAMHNREHVVILRPGSKGIVLHTMYFSNEVRKTDEFHADLSLVKEKELALAVSLVEALAEAFAPEKYQDEYRENLLRMIETKKKGDVVMATPEPHREKVVDIMEALKASLAVAKKPVSSAPVASSAGETKTAKRRARG